MKHISKFTFISIALGLSLIFYGYICRITEIYFFWESKSFGWIILFTGLISLLIDRIKFKKNNSKKSIFEKIVIGIIAFILAIKVILLAVIPNSEAYSVSKEYIKNNHSLTIELGDIKGFGVLSSGSVQKTTDSDGTYGTATVNIIVKGQNKYKDLTVIVIKYIDEPNWIVEKIEEN